MGKELSILEELREWIRGRPKLISGSCVDYKFFVVKKVFDEMAS